MGKEILFVLFISICILIIEIIREQCIFKITKYYIESPKLKGIQEKKIVFLSDLHNHCYGKNNERLLKAIKQSEPDIILVTGDMLIGKRKVAFDRAEMFMKALPEMAPTYYENGNHEQRMKENTSKYGNSYIEYKKSLLQSGVVFLENERVALKFDEKIIGIYGLEIPMRFYRKKRKHEFKRNTIEKLLPKSKKDDYTILLAHNPLHTSIYKAWGSDLSLSGHLHGGVVRLPIFGGLITPQFRFFPKYSGGIYKEEETTVIVSKGLGMHTIPFRLFNYAEMIMLHIQGDEKLV